MKPHPRCLRPVALTAFIGLLLLAGRPALAVERCAEPVERWLAAFSSEASVPATAQVCQARLLVVRLAPAGGDPLDVEVALGPGPAFRRVGELRVSPVLQVSDISGIPAIQRDAFERLVAYMDAHPDEVVVASPPVSEGVGRAASGLGVDFAGPRLLLLALLAAALALALGRRPTQKDTLTAAGLFGGGLLLRLVFGAWGPHHVNGQAVLWIAGGMLNPAELANYGPGYAEVFGWALVFGDSRPDSALFAINGVLSALIPVATYAVGRLGGLERTRAITAALVLVLEPVAVRIATTETYFVPIAALSLGAGACFMAAARDSGLPRAAWLAAGGLLVAQAARIHPVAWPLAAIAPVCAMATGGGWWQERLAFAGRAALAAFAITALTSASALLAVWGGLQSGVLSHPALPPDLWRFGVVAALLVALATRARPARALVPAGLAAVALLLTRHAYAPSPLLERTYDLAFAPLLLVGVWGALPPWRAVPSALLAAAVLAALLPVSLGAATTATTEQLEYAWLRERLRVLPTECRVLHVSYAGSRMMRVPAYDGREVIRYDERAPLDLGAALEGAACTVYVQSSLCGSPEGRPRCRIVERHLALTPRASTLLPSVPSVVATPYAEDHVSVSIFDVSGLAGATARRVESATRPAPAPAP